MMRKSIVTAAAVAAVAVGGTVADAAVKKGRFAGKTEEKDPIGFKVTKTHKVVNFYLDGVTLRCSDGDELETPTGEDRFELPSSLKYKISKSRRWHFAVKNDSGVKIKANGRFNKKGTKARGKLYVTARFDSQSGDQDPNGDVLCQSHHLKWNAKRQ
jgi:hypothetical protein